MGKLKLCIKTITCIILFFGVETETNAQSGEISCFAYKQIFKINGNWSQWPDHWTKYKSEGRSNPIIRVSTITKGSYYRIQLFIDGSVVSDFLATYDASLSSMKRKDWNDEYVNCYRDTDGNSVYTQGFSLQQVASRNSPWEEEDSKIYFWINSENIALVLK